MSCLGAKDTGDYYLSCCDCICDIDHKKELAELIEMWEKEFEEFEGLKIPDGKEFSGEVSYKEDCALGCTKSSDYEEAGCVGSGITKIDCQDCLYYKENEKILKKYLLQRSTESNIKPSMVVRCENGRYVLVFTVDEDCIHGWYVHANTSAIGRKMCELGEYVRVPKEYIKTVYNLKSPRTMPDGMDIYMLAEGNEVQSTFWEEVDPPVLELTVEDVEKKFGRKVKIVGGKDAVK
jgi:hypothetical protein